MNGTKPFSLTFMYHFWRAVAIAGLVPFTLFTLDLLLHPLEPDAINSTVFGRLLVGLVLCPLIVVLGALCVRKVPGNVIGWMLMALGEATSANVIRINLITSLPILLLVNAWILYFWFAFLLIPCYFPNGRLYPPRIEKWGGWVITLMCLYLLFSPLMMETLTFGGDAYAGALIPQPNPAYIPLLAPLFPFGTLSVFALFGLGSITMVLRYLKAQRHERRQIQYMVIGVVLLVAMSIVGSSIPTLEFLSTRYVSLLSPFIYPLAVAYAILRHQLYDIQVIIRRTLVYTIITAILALIYFGSVIVVQQVLRPLTESSDLAIVISTLAIAALFSPLRRRIQNVIDRRFFRRKYNAEQTLATFSQVVRDEVDLQTLQAALLDVVHETMQPTRIALWVRSPDAQHETKDVSG